MAKKPIEVKIGETMVKLSPLTLDDLESFENWVKSERLRLALEAIGATSGAERAAVISAVLREPVETEKEIKRPAGVCRLLWLCAAKNDPKLTAETFKKAASMDDILMMDALVDKLAMDDKGGNDTGHPTENDSQVGEQSE